jgi:sterol 14alpha-demethylase
MRDRMEVEAVWKSALALARPRKAPTGKRLAPELSGDVPVLGHLVDFVRDAMGLLDRAHRELGEVAGIRVGHKRLAALFGPDAHEAFFRAPDEVLNPSEAYKIMTPVFGKGIVYDASPERMSEQFKMLLPALKDTRMRTYGETIVAEVKQSIESWGDEGEVDLVDYCRVLTNFTSSHCLLGHEFRTGMTDEFAQVYHDLEQGVTPVAYLNAHLPIPSFRKRDKARKRCVEMIGSVIGERLRTGRQGEDFLQTLMDAKYKTGAKLTEDEITGMLLAAMFAGHHTSSVTTAWALIELIQNPDWNRRIVDQLDAVFADDKPVGFQSLREISLTEYAVKETLRLHPPLFMLVRAAMQDFVYKDYFFPEGTWLVISPTVAQRMPECFKDPNKFDPGRFAPPREEDKRDFAFIPFGGGRHKCMGNAFALLQIKAILTVLLRKYEFEIITPNIGSNFHGLVVGPTEPCRIRYRARKGVRTFRKPSARRAADANTEASRVPYRIELDTDFCQGHAACMGEAPSVFFVKEKGKVELLVERPSIELRAQVDAAAKYCPGRVIRIIEDKPAQA